VIITVGPLGEQPCWSESRTTFSARTGLTLPEIQTVMRHAQLSTTQRYMTPRLDELIAKLQAHYQRPAPPPVPASGYDPDDLVTVGGRHARNHSHPPGSGPKGPSTSLGTSDRPLLTRCREAAVT
jgi:hypothetical protein